MATSVIVLNHLRLRDRIWLLRPTAHLLREVIKAYFALDTLWLIPFKFWWLNLTELFSYVTRTRVCCVDLLTDLSFLSRKLRTLEVYHLGNLNWFVCFGGLWVIFIHIVDQWPNAITGAPRMGNFQYNKSPAEWILYLTRSIFAVSESSSSTVANFAMFVKCITISQRLWSCWKNSYPMLRFFLQNVQIILKRIFIDESCGSL